MIGEMWEVVSLNGATWEAAQKRLAHKKGERCDVISQKGGRWEIDLYTGGELEAGPQNRWEIGG